MSGVLTRASRETGKIKSSVTKDREDETHTFLVGQALTQLFRITTIDKQEKRDLTDIKGEKLLIKSIDEVFNFGGEASQRALEKRLRGEMPIGEAKLMPLHPDEERKSRTTAPPVEGGETEENDEDETFHDVDDDDDDDDGDDGDEDALTSFFEKCSPVCQCDIDESCPITQFELYKCVTCDKVLSGDDLSQEDHQQQCLGV